MNLTNIKLYDIQVLTVVLSSGSMAKAAEVLHTTRQSVARSISNLEDQLGHNLFDRNHKGMAPSDFCNRLMPYASSVIEHMEALVEFSEQYNTSHTTTIGLLGLYQRGKLLEFLIKDYQKKHSELQIQIKYKPWPDIHRAILAGELDYAYSSILPGYMPEEIKSIPVLKEDLVALMSQDDSLSGQEVVDACQLQNRDIILYSRYGIQALYLDQYQKTYGVHWNPYITTAEFDMLLDAVKSGSALGLVDKSVAIEAVSDNTQLTFRPISPTPTRISGFLYRNTFSPSPQQKKLIHYLKQGLNDMTKV